MKFTFESRASDSPYVEGIWRTESEGGGSFMSVAESHWGIVVTRQEGKTWLTVRGPETKAQPSPVPEDANFFGIVFKLGTFMPHLPGKRLVDCGFDLPEANNRKCWLYCSAWEFPTYDNADTFVARLVREGMLVREPVVAAALQGQLTDDLSPRSVQRRFLHATGLTHKSIQQIERAKKALEMLQQGRPILDTTYELGYFDQSHMTNSLKYFVGQTPAQIVKSLELA
ncbi:MAG: AraC family transcriptional regulator [Chloroflexi bacterium]|nr:AraC family transcriptional regulator [Chloroflexota bacterium]MCC6894901.1 helix-turn-helix transcriptional regulator [Anaerolineae bacterium]